MSDDETPPEPTKVSMIEAARRIGVSKSTMHRHIKNGRVSAERTEDGTGYLIDLSDLYRAFPEAFGKDAGTVSGTPSRNTVERGETDDETPNEIMALETQVQMLREMLKRADLEADRERRLAHDQIEDLKARLDREGEERRTLNARLLTYQMPPTPPAEPPPSGGQPMSDPGRRGGFLSMFRRAS